MIKLWAKVISAHAISAQTTQAFPCARPCDAASWAPILTSLCKPLDLACPVILQKHVAELSSFSRTVFRAGDFIESVSFDRFEVEILPEKKKPARVEYRFGDA